MSLDELSRTSADAHPCPNRALPWHLRKRFVLPVMAVLLVGAVSSTVLLASAIYTYVRVQMALSELQGDLKELGLLGSPTSDLTGPERVTNSTDSGVTLDATGGFGEMGESGTVSYELHGDLDGVTVTWVNMSTGSAMTRKARDVDFPLSFVVDGSWQKIGLEAHREGDDTGPLSCSVHGEGSFVLAEASDSGKGASVSCYS